MRAHRIIASALLAMLLAGCGAAASETARQPTGETKVPAEMHRMPGGSLMNDSDMAGMGSMSHAAQPSAAAKMICSDDTHKFLQETLGLDAVPESSSRWANGIYTCTYELSGGDLVASVHDATDKAAGRQYFDTVKARFPELKPIKGMASFGLPGYENGEGIVLFIKDGKTLLVDATGLPAKLGSHERSPAEAAYGLSATILACWSEH